MAKLSRLWARLRLAWSVFRHPRQLVPAEVIDTAEPPTGPLHVVSRIRNRVEQPLYSGRDGRAAARTYRAHRELNESLIYRVNGLVRDQHTP